jgi:Flp pilus assembly protein TadD
MPGHIKHQEADTFSEVYLSYYGKILRLNGKASDALKDFERVLELKPDHPEAHFSLAIVLTDQGEFQKAVPHFQSVSAE